MEVEIADATVASSFGGFASLSRYGGFFEGIFFIFFIFIFSILFFCRFFSFILSFSFSFTILYKKYFSLLGNLPGGEILL